ncbi:hypothetical protein [Photobacterium sp. R1]
MIPRNRSLVPYCPMMRAAREAAFTNGRGQYSYAKAFFRSLVGYSQPKASDLSSYFDRPSKVEGRMGYSIQNYLYAINTLLISDGYTVISPLSLYHRDKLFPGFRIAEKSRFKNRFSLDWQRKQKLAAKHKHQEESHRQEQFQEHWHELKQCQRHEEAGTLLGQWSDDDFDESILRALCERWYKENPITSWSFHELYADTATSLIILDFTLTD